MLTTALLNRCASVPCESLRHTTPNKGPLAGGCPGNMALNQDGVEAGLPGRVRSSKKLKDSKST